MLTKQQLINRILEYLSEPDTPTQSFNVDFYEGNTHIHILTANVDKAQSITCNLSFYLDWMYEYNIQSHRNSFEIDYDIMDIKIEIEPIFILE